MAITEHFAIEPLAARITQVLSIPLLTKCFRIDCFRHGCVHDYAGFNHCGTLSDLIIDNTAWPFCGEPVPLEEVMDDLCQRGVLEWKREPSFDVADAS